MKNSINFILQGKGGVGKSFATAILAQYFIDENHMDNIVVGDTDPVNTTTVKVKRLNADLIQITENSKVIQSKFDPMFESMLTNSQNTFVIDNGASTFLPLIQYFNDNCVMDMFEDVEQDVYIHTVIVGGQALADTLQGFEELKELVKGSKVKLIVWINEFQGIPALENIPLIETKFIEKNKDVIAGVVVIQDRKSDAFASDIKELTEKSLTLKEALESDYFGLMAKSRLKRVFNDIYKQLNSIYDDEHGE
ncbi:conjugal transfer protein TraL [Escherichia coli]|uniref:nucleotide-binding protein n=1 Tax=Escherichia coli TaxID=562 RepID=UPI001283900F|nr:conjugal transfer protein TraL [Escherichia coli]EBS2427115.1 conjugal transfer protein TraL [Salmonella enterica subsp. enterica serovar Uganda]EBW5669330.1 conjugal transfer protein TraL [Salmonella enterica subsp. enterica serovar Saintpaul]ECA9720354.1 conjugal transfer protein TraL [Salmonella enterica subsp. enterica serovar Typhimurium]EFV9111143.1 conjugal transfer protein TraL [Shigella sonnei]EHS0728633.1 conjugal transfer protein TraL [Salmonella enterica]